MNTTQIRQKIHDYVDRADDRFLNLVHSMVEAEETNIVGYQVDGTPISQEDLRARARISEQQIAAGQTISLEEFEQELEEWKKKKRAATK